MTSILENSSMYEQAETLDELLLSVCQQPGEQELQELAREHYVKLLLSSPLQRPQAEKILAEGLKSGHLPSMGIHV